MPKTNDELSIARTECALFDHIGFGPGSELDPTGRYFVCQRCGMIPFGRTNLGITECYETADQIQERQEQLEYEREVRR